MARSASLSIRVLVDAAQGAGQLRELGGSADDVGDSFKKMFAAAAAFAGVTAFIKSAVTAASDLQQSTGGVEAVFKSSADAVKNFAQGAAQSLGLSKSAYQELATVIGSQLKNAGTSMEDLAPKTNSLIEKGADLAAMFGGTTADAVGALSSALKGERDPIERYGVSLNQAAIDAEIMAKGMDTSTNAAKAAATQQATLNLIMKQTADSQGAAAREADSYASVMQQLSAVWENTIAEVGSALLPALSSIVGALGDMAPAAAAVLGPLAEFLGWVLQLPTPILAVAAGIALWKFSPISAMLSKLGASMASATGSAAGFGSAMKSIGTTLAGGGLIAGAFFLFQELAGTLAENKRLLDSFNSSVITLANELIKTGDAGAQSFKDLQQQTLEQSDAFKALTGAGISYGDAMNFFTDQSKLSADATSAVNDALSDMDPNLQVNALAMTQLGSQVAKTAEEKKAYLAAEQAATGATEANSEASQAAAEAQAKAAEAQAKAALEAAKSAAAQTQVKLALDSVQAAATSAARGVDFFVLSMQQAAGMNVTMDQAAKLLNDTLRGTAEAFTASSDKGNLNTAALTDWNAAAITSTSEGSALYDQLLNMQTAYATTTTAAYNQAAANGDTAAGMAAAAGAADTAYSAFITMATSALGSSVAAEQLAAKLGIVQGTNIDPKTFTLIAQDQQADQAVADLQSAQIADKTVTVGAVVGGAVSAFSGLTGQSLGNTVKVDADPKAAQSTINGVVNEKRTTTPINVTADPSQANSTVNGFTQTQRSTQVQVTANITAAQNSINSLVNGHNQATITVVANTSPAQQAINSVVNGSYTATINVTANTAAARSAIASVPTVVGAAAPMAMAAPMGLMAMDARAFAAPAFTPAAPPPLHRGLAVNEAAPQSITYEINVANTLDSADSIARRVMDLVERRERRINGIRVQAQ